MHTFLRAGHTRARDFMKTIVSAATARNDDVRSDVNSRSLRSTNLKGIIFHATSHTRALARTTPVDRNTPPARSLAPDELRGEPAVLSARVERRIGSSVRYRPVTEKKLGHVSEISLFILFYFIFFLFIAESSNSTLDEREVREFDIACGTVMAAVLKVDDLDDFSSFY